MYNLVLLLEDPKGELAKTKEQSVYGLAKLLSETKNVAVLKQLLVQIRPFLNTIAKAKTAKIVRQVVEIVGRTIEDLDLQVIMCGDAIEWCKQERRTFLKQRMQTRL